MPTIEQDKMSENFPFSIEPLPEDENERIKKDFEGYLSGAVRVQPKGYFFQGIYKDYANAYINFKVNPTDVFVASYPKTGTTWTQEMVWLLVRDLDYEGAKVPLDQRFPFIEADHILDPQVLKSPKFQGKIPPEFLEPGFRLSAATNCPQPRTIKTHMPFSLLPPTLLDTCKVIYVIRDPRDVVVSFYHHHRMWPTHGYVGDFKTFFKYFINEQIMYSPFWEHAHEAWELRNHPNLLMLTYEDMKKDLPAVITRVATFLGKSLNQEQLAGLAKHLHFDSMKKNPATNAEAEAQLGILDTKEGGFVRKGASGGWRQYFDEKMVQEFEEWMVKKGKGLEREFKWLL